MAATGFLQPPPPMEPRTSSPAITWKKWQQIFEIYMTAARKTEANDDVKTSLLLHAIGPEGIEIFNTFTFTEEEVSKYTSTLAKFQAHFVPKVNLTYERHRFFTRNMQVGESIDKYVTDLRILARTCAFGTLGESLIKDRLVCGVGDTGQTERLLRVSDLDLEKALDICRASEASKEELRKIEGAEHSVDAVQIPHKPPEPVARGGNARQPHAMQ